MKHCGARFENDACYLLLPFSALPQPLFSYANFQGQQLLKESAYISANQRRFSFAFRHGALLVVALPGRDSVPPWCALAFDCGFRHLPKRLPVMFHG
jgi:hypothetical protein